MTQQVAPQKGNTLVTTLDVNMQKFAEEACKEAYDEYSPEYTSSIIMNPQTGEVYAMAQYPTFDSNDPMNLSDLTDKAKKTAFDAATETEKYALADKAWKNFAITETFEPGSIFKPIVAAMALEEGVISPNDSFYCGGYKEYGGYKITCHNRYGHGTLSLEQVLAQSCNVGMMEIMSKLGKDSFYKYRSEFGYMQKNGNRLACRNGCGFTYA
jgi:stage V sporulation protein D (sporulation-specific penicillin-binding protein)